MSDCATLPALLNTLASAIPGAVGFVEGDRETTFSQLDLRSSSLAAGLHNQGISAGDRVAVWLPNRIDWLVCLFALARLRAVCVAVNTRFRSAEVEDIVGRSKCKALIFEPGFRSIDFAGILRDADPGALADLELIVTTGPTGDTTLIEGARTVAMDELLRTPDAPLPDAAPDDPVMVFTTSGTTSKPKFVLHSQASLAIHGSEVARGFDYISGDTVLLQALPLCGTFGLAQAMAGIAAGRPSILMPAFDAGEAARLISRHRVTTFNGSDDMLARICDAAGPGDLQTVKWCGYAAFTNARLLDFVTACEARGIRAAGLYGMSEVQALYARQRVEAEPPERCLAGGVLTSPDAAVEVRDPESGALVPIGQSGELYLKGPSRLLEYMDNPDATAKGITEDGFVRSGDLGYLCEDGRFVFETRMGDGLRLGGFLVNPAEIDAWLERHPAVSACQTVGAALDGRTHPVSFVIAQAGACFDEQALIDHCRQGLAKFKIPTRVFALDRFPTTDGPNGEKIQRGRLRELAEHHLSTPTPQTGHA